MHPSTSLRVLVRKAAFDSAQAARAGKKIDLRLRSGRKGGNKKATFDSAQAANELSFL
ncbi:MAG: hypothetical protein ACP5O2_07905 [Bacteroidales bacterium]